MTNVRSTWIKQTLVKTGNPILNRKQEIKRSRRWVNRAVNLIEQFELSSMHYEWTTLVALFYTLFHSHISLSLRCLFKNGLSQFPILLVPEILYDPVFHLLTSPHSHKTYQVTTSYCLFYLQCVSWVLNSLSLPSSLGVLTIHLPRYDI